MQQAERADSTASTIASGGNFDQATVPWIPLMAEIPSHEIQGPIDDALDSAAALDTMLMSIWYTIEYAIDEAERNSASSAAGVALWRAVGMLKHIKALTDIALQERSRTATVLDRCDEVITAHTIWPASA